MNSLNITANLARLLIEEQFPEYAHLEITHLEKQGHDNRTFRLGEDMLIRMPAAIDYEKQVEKEHEILPKLAQHLSVSIPAPIKMGKPCRAFPYHFSIYKWLAGTSINLLLLTEREKEILAVDLAVFLKELHNITEIKGPKPGIHNFWRGEHISIYEKAAREQIKKLAGLYDPSFYNEAIDLLEKATATKWQKEPVWVHGDFAIGNMLVDGYRPHKLSAIIDFGCSAQGDPACDLVIAFTYFEGIARQIFIKEMNLDSGTWLRAKAWALWKASFELCRLEDKSSPESLIQQKIISEVINGKNK